MRNVRTELTYDGGAFHGWQRQEGFDSVQEALEDAVEAATGERVVLHGSGRTDTGVHALRQVASFHVETRLDDDRLRHAVNAHLPPQVVVRRLETCRDEFHARFDAVGKRYAYLTATTRFRPPLGRGAMHWIPQSLDAEAMRRAAADLVGEHDFKAFSNSGSERESTVRSVRALRLVRRRERFALVIEADGFLYNMVRIIAGTLIEVGRGRSAPEMVRSALESGRRDLAGPTAPAEGLYLVRVRYGESVFGGADRGPRGAPGLFGG
ncbi:MAG: tRNA pseudouridine(38-40) synthase TruA [Planctomycetota bacterium]|jgi:tRNA pseudouridine38-40 synthase|nr:tRNA pseudouridine(38-40) synthase TruA [Planctomycetota bacterium]MDP6988268.1 tRNA pseudouridine(38-40) synthase TruA [Planctomycetota bacterium]